MFTLNLTREQSLRLRRDPSLVGTNNDPQYLRAISILRTRYSVTPALPEPVGIRLEESF